MKKLIIAFFILLLVSGFAFARGAQEVEIIDIEEEEVVDEFEGIVSIVHDGWEQGKPGGRFVMSSFGSGPRSFNTIVAAETSTTDITDRLYSGLVRRNQMTLDWEMSLAESYTISADEKTITYKLKPDLKWSDGEPLTAADFVDAVNLIYLDPEVQTNSRSALMPSGIATEWEQLDDLTLSVTFPFVYAGIFNSTSVAPLPMHILRPIVDEQGAAALNAYWGVDTDVRSVVGNGPFVIDSYTPGQRAVLKKNPYYYEKDEWGVQLPYIDELVFEFVPDTDTQLQRFLAGALDFLAFTGDQVALGLDRKDEVGFTLYSVGPAASSQFITINQNPNSPALADTPKLEWVSNRTFRQALAHLVDRQTMVDTIVYGYGYPQYSFIPVFSPYYWDGSPDFAFPYDPERAKDMLDSIGYVDQNGDGWRQDPDGNKISLDLKTNAGNAVREAMGELFSQDAREIGLDITFQPEDFNVMVGRLLSSFDWELILIGLTGSVDPISGANVYPSSGNLHMIEPLQESPRRAWEARVDELWDYANNTTSEQQRVDGYREMQQIWIEEVPWVFTINAAVIHGWGNEWGNIYPHPVQGNNNLSILHRVYQK